jgi:hypothetical protein
VIICVTRFQGATVGTAQEVVGEDVFHAQHAAFQFAKGGPVDLEHGEPRGDLGLALRESIEPGAEDDILPDAATRLFDHQVFDEAGARHDRGASPRVRGEVERTK